MQALTLESDIEFGYRPSQFPFGNVYKADQDVEISGSITCAALGSP